MNIEIHDAALEARIRKQLQVTGSRTVEEVLLRLLETQEEQDRWLSENRHMRQDLTNEDVKFFPVYSNLIVYRPKTKPLQIACILHGRRDVEQVLKGRL